jgi:hypothetical protein
MLNKIKSSELHNLAVLKPTQNGQVQYFNSSLIKQFQGLDRIAERDIFLDGRFVYDSQAGNGVTVREKIFIFDVCFNSKAGLRC